MYLGACLCYLGVYLCFRYLRELKKLHKTYLRVRLNFLKIFFKLRDIFKLFRETPKSLDRSRDIENYLKDFIKST